MKQLFVMLFLLLPVFVYGQRSDVSSGYVEGKVIDKQLEEPVYSASVSLLRSDSSFVKGITTDSLGYFRLSAPVGQYIMQVSFVGYQTAYRNIQLTDMEPVASLGNVYIQDKSIQLGEAVITGEAPAIVVKGDTIEYNSSSYNPEENAMLRDLINNIPGLEADEAGNILANGKPVTKILVDGKEFFGNDIALALSNLPANMIKKLQIFKDESESSKITGFKDKEPEQTLNLVVKEELKESIFGDAMAGAGNHDRYNTRLSTNYMKGEKQVMFVGQLNNVSQSPWSVSNKKDKQQTFALSTYFNPMKKMELGLYARYSSDTGQDESYSNTQYYLDSGDRISKQEMMGLNKSRRLSTGFNLKWEVDSVTTIYARSGISFNNNESANRTTGVSYVQNAADTTRTDYHNRTKGDGYSINSSITAGRKLNSKGRAVSLSLNHSTRKSDDKGTNESSTIYTGSTPSILLDQRFKTDNTNNSYGFTFDYIEPMGEDNLLRLSYTLTRNKSNRDRNTYKQDAMGNYTLIDSTYTRETENKNTNQSISLEFQRTKEKYNYTIGVSVDPSSSQSDIWLLDSVVDNLKQSVVNYSPSLHFSYKPNNSTTFDIGYYGSTSYPSTRQLSADTTVVNATNKTYGNPDLKPSYRNQLNLFYQKSDYEKGSFLMVSGGFNYTFNDIAAYSLIDNLGNTENTYRNVDGNMSADLSFMLNTPLRNKKFTISTNTFSSYYRNVGFSNGKKAITNNYVISEDASLKYKVEKFETTLRASASFNFAKNNLSQLDNQNTATYKVENRSKLKLPLDFTVQSDFFYSRYSGYGDDFKKNEFLWNASVSKEFLKKKKGRLKLEFFDILQDRNNLRRVVTSTYSSDTRTNTISRYFMLSFTYKFNIFRGAKSTSDEDMDI
ncbi:outer membrane beta-barrel protein [Dysgonomonas sp. 25]|uniref:outer membrane beta-barrel protein n=1 Tax=Dysgonomonas sp. 25 TaxID=2302933 RepID=UPI0013D51DA5|nr:outer membrane beta-barrel protein [Dysgonomonas sp. 25]NDV69457.1 TonB-dependent receptor [Dysgonomonas sp. 25]